MSIRSVGSRMVGGHWQRALLALVLMLSAASRARAAGVDPLRLADMGQRALKLYDDLDFNRAKATLEQALAEAKTGGLDHSSIAARLRLYLGLVLAAGLQQPDAASAQFKLAAKIDPTITPPDGLFNPRSPRSLRRRARQPPPTMPAATADAPTANAAEASPRTTVHVRRRTARPRATVSEPGAGGDNRRAPRRRGRRPPASPTPTTATRISRTKPTAPKRLTGTS